MAIRDFPSNCTICGTGLFDEYYQSKSILKRPPIKCPDKQFCTKEKLCMYGSICNGQEILCEKCYHFYGMDPEYDEFAIRYIFNTRRGTWEVKNKGILARR